MSGCLKPIVRKYKYKNPQNGSQRVRRRLGHRVMARLNSEIPLHVHQELLRQAKRGNITKAELVTQMVEYCLEDLHEAEAETDSSVAPF